MKLSGIKRTLPHWRSAALAFFGAVLLILAFPDFELSYVALVSFVPLFWAIEREKDSVPRSFFTGWIFGVVFFFGSCWWLTYAPITYAGFPRPFAYLLLLIACLVVGIFSGVFGALFGRLLKRFGPLAIFTAPFVWVFTEFLRFWLTGNTWNALAYSQFETGLLQYARYGGIYLVSGIVLIPNVVIAFIINSHRSFLADPESSPQHVRTIGIAFGWPIFLSAKVRDTVRTYENAPIRRNAILIYGGLIALVFLSMYLTRTVEKPANDDIAAVAVTVQVNVPMSGLTLEKWSRLRERHVALTESAIAQIPAEHREKPLTIIFPESPMNFMYEEDREFQSFLRDFASKHNAHILFNSAEPDPASNKYFNSAVLVDQQGKEVVQYDKIYLVPFGESVPMPFTDIIPGLVGSFAYGSEYDLFPLGDAKAGVMLCYESHFGQLSRRFVSDGADVLIEMTNDGYLGPTPVLRQHLASSVFRAVETNRPVLRTTNVGITAYINENGKIIDPAPIYEEDIRVWTVSRSDGSQTLYVRFGDWFAWASSLFSIGLLIFGRRKAETPSVANGTA